MTARSPAELYQAGEYQEAVMELQSREKALNSEPQPESDDSLELANTRLALGMCYLALGEESAALESLTAAERGLSSLDVDPSVRANALDLLARAQQQSGQLTKAEAAFREALSWREKAEGPDSAYWLGVTRDHLALLLLAAGSYQESGRILNASLEATPENEPKLLAQRHHYLARYLLTIRNYHRAIVHGRTSLEIARTVEGLDVASYLDVLALAQFRSGDQAGAEASLLESLEHLRQQPDSLHRARGEAEILNKVGEFALSTEPAMALEAFQEALQRLKQWLPADHPSLATYHNNIGLAAMKNGDYVLAEREIRHALNLISNQIDGLQLGHQRQAEWKQNLAWNALLSGNASLASEETRAACLEAEATLQHLLAEGTERERLNFLAHFDLYSLPACAGEVDVLHRLLANNKGRLLDNLISSKQETGEFPFHQGNLGRNLVFVDFVRYRKPSSGSWTAAYGAVVELANGEVSFVPLGEERVLLRWLTALSERLSYRSLVIGGQEVEPPVIRMEATLRKLHELFLAPVLAALPAETQTLVFSPDGSLHFLPFAVLLDDEGKFFSDRFRNVLFVSSRRDLFDGKAYKTLQGGRWDLVGISRFETRDQNPDVPWFIEDLGDLPFVPDELKSLKAIAPEGSREFLDPTHPEELLRNMEPGAAVLHLASHAFFRDPDGEEAAWTDLDAHPEILLRSGLALSHPQDGDDGILYPYEIAQLPLEQTRLVTLSACHTGLGTPLAGEGVLGLRRAFALAGAQSLLLTLWQVPDESTADFMFSFYQEALRTECPSQTLWSLQSQLLRRDGGLPGDDAALEEAVLRYGPFLITHRGPIREVQPKPAAAKTSSQVFWWRYLLWIAVFALTTLVLTWIAGRRNRRRLLASD
ncbi:CHAT domain-containing protein [Roseibacillus persicicus]|uniref:CHAT domain-containing protein n=1 Tax=Roseibacillus persicicus TaxID=454148 RepID=UPI00167712D3|nr:CHAT domain-containing protein [Roseibacillus persicicus]